MRKPKPRFYIRPAWCGWTGQATMAYIVTTCDPWSDDGGRVVEFSVSKPAMGNKWVFRRTAHETIRNSFFISMKDVSEQRNWPPYRRGGSRLLAEDS